MNQKDIEEMRWKGVANLEPAQVNELLRLAELGLKFESGAVLEIPPSRYTSFTIPSGFIAGESVLPGIKGYFKKETK